VNAKTPAGRWDKAMRENAAAEGFPVADRDDAPCPETSDSQHCGHWHDGEKCCACGQDGPEEDLPAEDYGRGQS